MRKLHLPIAEPCHENWDGMDPVERGRLCHSCSKQVYHLSAMTEREARTLLAERCGERICVRYGCDSDGGIRFKPERPAAAAAAAGVLSLALAACAPHDNPDHRAARTAPVEHVEPADELMGGTFVEAKTPVEPQRVVMGQAPVEVEELMGDVMVEPVEEPEPCALTQPAAAKAVRAKHGGFEAAGR